MGLSLTTFASGAAIDASTLRTRMSSIETYINEETVAADRATAWMATRHIYRPDFYGAPNPHTRLVSGESYFRHKLPDIRERVMFSWYMGTTPAWFPVPGLVIPVQIPESLSQGSTYYRLVVDASFYVYEWGGDAVIDERTNLAADVGMILDNNAVAASSVRPLYNGSLINASNFNGTFYARKQHAFSYCFAGSGSLAPGMHHVGVGVRLYEPTGTGNEWKFIIFQQGNVIARYYIR